MSVFQQVSLLKPIVRVLGCKMLVGCVGRGASQSVVKQLWKILTGEWTLVLVGSGGEITV